MKNKGLVFSFFKSRIVQIMFMLFLFLAGVSAGAFSQRFLPIAQYQKLADSFETFFSSLGQATFSDLFTHLFTGNMQQLLLAILFTLTLTGVLLLPVLSVFTGFLYGLSLGIIIGVFGATGAYFNVLYFIPRLVLFIPVVLLFYSQCFTLCLNIALRILNKSSNRNFRLGTNVLICIIFFFICVLILCLSALTEAWLAPYLVFNIFQ